jgi:hypothetical protein
MDLLRRLQVFLVAAAAIALIGPAVLAQQPAPAEGQPPARRSPHRVLAPHVMKPVDPERRQEEAFSKHNVVELLAFDPNFKWAEGIHFRHEVWALTFEFKPMRMIWVDVPQASGQMRRKLIWYLVYSVTNPGKVMVPFEDLDLSYQTFEGKKVYQIKEVDKPIRFIPEFLLEGRDSVSESEGFNKAYPDRVIPVAMAAIRLREDRSRRFYTTVEMCREIAVGETVWGIATWEDLDPQIDRFSVYIKGLTNAYKWFDEPGEYTRGAALGTGRRLMEKTLRLNFWRPGDEYLEHEKELRYGFPGEVDYEWVYR